MSLYNVTGIILRWKNFNFRLCNLHFKKLLPKRFRCSEGWFLDVQKMLKDVYFGGVEVIMYVFSYIGFSIFLLFFCLGNRHLWSGAPGIQDSCSIQLPGAWQHETYLPVPSYFVSFLYLRTGCRVSGCLLDTQYYYRMRSFSILGGGGERRILILLFLFRNLCYAFKFNLMSFYWSDPSIYFVNRIKLDQINVYSWLTQSSQVSFIILLLFVCFPIWWQITMR